jgi:benzoyl-CoA reductase/2-hydroxyglutaryl-CoA dehydratase subunit BcrC/BadD/HgdB
MLDKMVDKFAKRIQKLSQNPSATGLQSTKLAYEMIRDYYHHIAHSKTAQEPLIIHDGFVPAEILDAMDIKVLNLEFLAYHCVQASPYYIDLAEKAGVSSDTCSSCRCEIGIVLDGSLPQPDFIIFETGTCENQFKTNAFLADYFHCPLFALNTPYYLDQSSVKSYVKELQELINFLEEITRKKLNYDRLQETSLRFRRAYASMRELNELRKAIPCPIRGRDALRNIGIVMHAGHDLRTVEYFEGVCEEVRRRVNRGEGVVPEERYRLLWCHTAPLFTDIFTFLEEEYGAVVVFDELSYVAPPADESLGLLESIAFEKIQYSWNGPAERRLQILLKIAEEYKIDAAIHFSQWGCQIADGSAKMIRDTLEERLGIPTLILEGDYMDYRINSEEQIKAKLAAFMDILEKKK